MGMLRAPRFLASSASKSSKLTPLPVCINPLQARSKESRYRGLAGKTILSGQRQVQAQSVSGATAVPNPTSVYSGPAGAFPSVANRAEYDALYKKSLENPEAFWTDISKAFYWKKGWAGDVVSSNFDISKGPVFAKWFDGAVTNLAYNCLDRHIEAGNGDRVCFFWEGNDEGQGYAITYKDLHAEVCRLANWLKAQGVKRGDTVTIYMPMLVELPAAMLACARIGAVHSVVFGGFSAEALANRLEDARSAIVITCSAVMRGPKPIPLKKTVDEAMTMAEKAGCAVAKCLVFDHVLAGIPRTDIQMAPGRDVWWQDEIPQQSAACDVEWMDAEDPLFRLYTSGSTGKPKGVVHTTGGYMVGAATTMRYVFDVRPDADVYWCTADCGWITGHSYVTYGPLLLGATQVLFEGVPTYPDAGRCWKIVEKYNVSLFYTAPTAIRSLMGKGNDFVTQYNRSSLRVLGSVGEPINPEAWKWYNEVIGESRCPIVDTWWQTETGAHMITPLAGAFDLKPGSATLPFFGVEPAVLDEKGNELEGECEGYLVIKRSWPSQLRTLAGDHARFEQTYYSSYNGYYFTGDGCRRDKDGYYWLTGRVDDVINVSGHRIGTAEVESALVMHPACVEAAVVPMEHPIKGQGIYAFVTLADGHSYPASEDLRKELVAEVRKHIGPIATPDVIHWAPGLPKTRSGKIMRRILRKIADGGSFESFGDVSTLAEPAVVDTLLSLRKK